MNGPRLYDIIKGESFEEEFGIYYQEDVVSGETDTSIDDGNYSDSSTPDVNKTKKRIVTYIQQ